MTIEIGDYAVDFELPNANEPNGGKSLDLAKSAKANGLVIVFECNHCPYVVASIDRMNDIAEFCAANEIGFVGINSNLSLIHI